MIFFWLAAVLAVGGLSSLLLVPPAAFGRRFHRLIGFMASLLLAAGFAGGALKGRAGAALVIASAIWVLVTQWGPLGALRPTLALLVALGWATLLLGGPEGPRLPLLTSRTWAVHANGIAAGLYLGSVTLGMLVGHWYLNVPGLDIRYLRRMTRWLAGCLILRLLVGLAGIASSVPTPVTGALSPWRVVGVAEGFFYWQRLGIGLVGPAVLTFMIDRTVSLRSTQSATGLLYVAVVLVLIGEMVSRFLYVAFGIPQ